MQDYPAITRMLQDPSLSLELIHHIMNGGIKNIRWAAIIEPHPQRGKLGRDLGSGFYFTIEDTRIKEGYKHQWGSYGFQARDTQEVLELLERACNDEDARNTVSFDGYTKPVVHGHQEPRGGLDDWIFNDFRLSIKCVNAKLVSSLNTRNFSSRNTIVTETITDTVGQAVAPYEQYLQEMSDILHVKRGDAIQSGIKRNADLERPKFDLAESARESFDNAEFFRKYEAALQRLAPLNITQDAKNALFTSMLIESVYGVTIPATV